ncbi:hypothetical protein K474DRAFT_1609794 [Panus rudis PR-1116 ss-1]|nr:hypothetical protein K474DRAFT_1609794 [Panus rudis PR-1116 ss-1]
MVIAGTENSSHSDIFLADTDSSDSEQDSLFDETEDSPEVPSNSYASPASQTPPDTLIPARLSISQIPGLYFNPNTRLATDVIDTLLRKCISTFFQREGANQVMLFERVQETASLSRIPTFLVDLLHILSRLLQPLLPSHIHSLLFPPATAPPQARQVIINHYLPGEGITPHVDLLDRFGDGIIGVSLGSGESAEVYLPPGSVYVMSGEARYRWTHGIEGRKADLIERFDGDTEGAWVQRTTRVSITFRWLLPGADVVGGV